MAATNVTSRNKASGASQVVVEYLTAFSSGHFDRARSLVSDDFSFRGPRLSTVGRDAFFAAAEGKDRFVRGFRMLRQWEDGNEVCSVYELDFATPAGAGSLVMSEWHTIRDGRLASSLLVFDTSMGHAVSHGA